MRSLSGKQCRLVRLTVTIVLGLWDELDRLRRQAPPGEPDRAWREAALQTHLFGGFPRLVEACEVLDRAGGLGDPGARAPGEEEAGAEGIREAREARGAALFEAIYGEQADQVRARLAGFDPDLARWIAEHAYGRVLSRPGLGAATRELCAVAALVATGQDRQLASHARGALRLGAEAQALAAVPSAIADLVPAERLRRGRTVLERFAR